MAKKTSKKHIEQYEHFDKERANNPHVGLVTPSSDPDTGTTPNQNYENLLKKTFHCRHI